MYYIVYGALYAFSLLPWRVMYFLSDMIYGLVYYVIGYRRPVVMGNLAIAFPEKTEKEKIRIAKDFYHNFIDTFIETIKLLSVSKKNFQKRISINQEVINDLSASGMSVQLHAGHFFNWEFLNLGVAANTHSPFIGVFIPLSNKIFERLMIKLRSRFGTIMMAAPDFKTSFHQYTKAPYLLGLIADQNPGNPNKAYWCSFFGKLTPFVKGPEKGAKKMNTAVVMIDLHKVKRGYYKIECELLTTTPNDLPEGAITKALIQFIEDAVKKRPANYLWSHRRWKFVFDPEKYQHLVV